jgi:hypothetical protein
MKRIENTNIAAAFKDQDTQAGGKDMKVPAPKQKSKRKS